MDMFGIWARVVLSNWAFWIALVITFSFAGYRRWRNPTEYTLWEFAGTLGGLVLLIPLTVYVFFKTATDLPDHCFNGSHIVSSSYFEGWTEEYTESESYTDSNGKSQTRLVKKRRHHPPEWYYYTADGESGSIDSGDFQNYVNHFGNRKFEHLFHVGQISWGDGNAYHTQWNSKTSSIIPAAYTYHYDNYVKGAKFTLYRQRGLNPENYKGLILPYPELEDHGFGSIYLNRVHVAGVSVPEAWRQELNRRISIMATEVGPTRQACPQIYIVGTTDHGFANVLRQEWVGGKKNDVILIIGMKKWPEIEWSQVMCWSERQDFPLKLASDTVELKDASDPSKVLSIFEKNMRLYKRQSFKKFRYLLTEASIPTWGNITIIFLMFGICWLTTYLLEHNQIREWASRSYNFTRDLPGRFRMR